MAFLCCSSGDRPSKHEAAEMRHARLVAATNNPSARSGPLPRRWDHPLEENPPRYEDVAVQPFLSIDQKAPLHFQLIVQPAEEAAPPPPASVRSSIVSVPSTRMTDLTATQTGETLRTSQRMSLELVSSRGSLPPYSHHPRRSASPASVAGSENERDAVWQHPVMASNWMEALRQNAPRQPSSPRGGSRLGGNVPRG